MIKIIIGKKGSGKTKLLAEMVNTAADTSLGNVVCIEKSDALIYSIKYKARLIDTDTYAINGYDEYRYSVVVYRPTRAGIPACKGKQ